MTWHDLTRSHVHGLTMADAIKELSEFDHAELVTMIVNTDLNEFVGGMADYRDGEDDPHGHGKRVPYVGWFWRSTDWVGGRISIGDCGEFIGVMENNKWDYPQRRLTDGEARAVTEIVWEARDLSRAGGSLADSTRLTNEKLDELWALFQTFTISEAN